MTHTPQAYLSGGGAPDIEDAPRATRFPGAKAAKDKKEQSVCVCVVEVVGLHNSRAVPGASASGPAAAARGGLTGAKPVGAGAKASGAGIAGAAAEGQGPARKKQRSMFDFVQAKAKVAGSGGVGSQGEAGVSSTPVGAARAGRKQAGVVSNQAGAEEGNQGQGDVQGAGSRDKAGGYTAQSDVDDDDDDDVGVLLRATPPAQRAYLMVKRPEGKGLLAGLWEFPGEFVCHWVPLGVHCAVLCRPRSA